jgi:HAD superfamily hydrolase (TIGR01549 family)
VPLAFGAASIDGVLFDLDDVLIPFQTPYAWQWAWRPQGPILGERKVKAAIRRSLRLWDRRRWAGLTGRDPPADLPALRGYLSATLLAIAGHALPAEESEAVVRRMLHPMGEVERYPDAPRLLERLSRGSVRVGVTTPLPAESARWLLKRVGFPESLLLVAGDPPSLPVPDPAAYAAAADRLGVPPERTAYVGDLLWSDVRAAHRAGFAAILLDRHDAWPRLQAGRVTTLEDFERVLALGPATPAPGASESEEP